MTFIQRLQKIYEAHQLLGMNLSVNAEQFREMVGFAVLHTFNLSHHQDHQAKTSRFSQEIAFIDDKVQIRSTMNDNQVFTIQMSAGVFKELIAFFKEQLDYVIEGVSLRTWNDIPATLPIMRSIVLQAVNEANFHLNGKDILLSDYWFNLEMIDDKNQFVKAAVNISDLDNENNLSRISFSIYGVEDNHNGTFSTNLDNVYFTGYLNYNRLKGLILNSSVEELQ